MFILWHSALHPMPTYFKFITRTPARRSLYFNIASYMPDYFEWQLSGESIAVTVYFSKIIIADSCTIKNYIILENYVILNIG